MTSLNIPVGTCPDVSEAHLAPLFTFAGVEGLARVTYVYDLDSFSIAMNLFGGPVTLKTRLLGVDGPELRNRNLKEKSLAYMGRDRVTELCHEKVVYVRLHGGDKYNRELVTVHLDNSSGADLAKMLVDEHLCQPYDGGTKQSWESFMHKYHPDISPYKK